MDLLVLQCLCTSVAVSDYPPVQATPWGNLKLVLTVQVSPLVLNYPLNFTG